MSLLRNNGSQPNYQGRELEQWGVYGDRSNRLGTVVNTLTDASGALQFFVVDLGNRQVILPASNVQIDSTAQRVYWQGASNELANAPAYPSTRSERRTSTQTPSDTRLSLLETSAPLESPTPLEGWSQERLEPPMRTTETTVQTSTHREIPEALVQIAAPLPRAERVEGNTIQLLEERLNVTSQKRKIGDVVVRKVIETRMLQVPVRREKLVVEQISPESQTLAVVDLKGDLESVEIAEIADTLSSDRSVAGEFHSAASASQFLAALARQPNASYQAIEVRIVLDNPKLEAVYQKWMERFLANEGSQFEDTDIR
ncbi:MAG: YsnF/AvaK domain-containing protein [Desertifilum sp.]|nr:YsnF/AvaK domain-containing protein [Desertifilum sp.]